VTGVVSWPLVFTAGPNTSIEEKRQTLETYANQIIARFRGAR